MTEPPIIHPQTPGQIPANQFSDPPRSGPLGGNFGGQGLPPQYPPPGAGGRRLLFILLALLGCMFLFCAGLVVWLGYSFQSKSPMTAEFRERHSPVNALPGESFREPLRQPTAIADESTDGLAEFVAELSYAVADDEVVDFSRFIQEAQNSGEAVGINAVTRLLWIQAAKLTTDLPQFSENNVVIGMQWLVPERELRATIVSYWDEYDQPEVWYLYLTKSGDEWKLFDWREALEPMSEAQFFAVYNATSTRMQDDFTEFAYEVDELYYDEAVPLQDKPNKTIDALRRRRYPQNLLPYAQHHCAQYLVLYEDGQMLSELTKDMEPRSSFGASYYKGYAAYLLDDHATAFQYAERIMDELGWYPAAAILAGYAAETDEQKRKAAGWLATCAALMPDFSLPVEQLFDVADDAVLERAISDFSKVPSKLIRFVTLVDSLMWAESGNLERLVRAAQGVPELADVLVYGQFMLARQAQSPDEALQYGARLLADARYEDYHEVIQTAFAETAVRDGMLDKATALAPNRLAFVRAVRAQTLSRWEVGLDWQAILELIGTDVESGWREELETQVATARCLLELGRDGESLDILIPCLVSDGASLLGGEDGSPAYVYFDVAAEAALKCDRVQELVDAIDEPETAFVVLAEKADELDDASALRQLIDWYETTGAPAVWKHYYRSQLAYSNGEAQAALQEMSLAVQQAALDERLTEFELPVVVEQFCPDSDTLHSDRIEIALRCGALLELVEELVESEAYDGDWQYYLDWHVGDFEAPELLPELVATLSNSDVPELELLRHQLRSDQYVLEGEMEAAFDALLEAAKISAEVNGYDYFENPSLSEATEMVLAYPELHERFNDLYPISASASQKVDLRAASALLAKDAKEFQNAMKEYESEWDYELWHWEVPKIKAQQRAGVWLENNKKHPADLQSIYRDGSAHSAVFMNRPASEVESELVRSFSEAVGQPLENIDRESFPDSVGVYTAKLPEGVLLLALFDGQPSAIVVDSDFTRHSGAYAGCCALTLVPEVGCVLPHTKLRTWAAKFGTQFDASSAYYDGRTDCWYQGAGWAQRLLETASTGFDPQNPKAKTAFWESKKEPVLIQEDDPTKEGAAVHYSAGLITERIPVVIESKKGGAIVVRMKADSLSAPYLVQDTLLEMSP